eukprot:UN13494
MVTRVTPGLQAVRKGVQLNWSIMKVDGHEINTNNAGTFRNLMEGWSVT